MNAKKKGITLVEVIIAIAIGAILLSISTNWYVTNLATSNNSNNKQVDLQSGVSTSLDMIKSTLKKTTQVHLVGKNVYDPDKKLEDMKAKLDENYNYIALSKDENGNYNLVNIVNNKGKWESFPIFAQAKNDNLQSTKISYNMLFYQKDDKYRDKLDRNILNITVRGNAHDVDDTGKHINSHNDRFFELSQDIDLANVNQILISKHLEGGIDQVTAIAYDNAKIQGETQGQKVKKMSFVFAIDNSSSMRYDLNSNTASNYDNSRKKVARDSINNFIKQLNDLGKKSGIEINAYIFTWGGTTLFEKAGNTLGHDATDKYIYPLEKISPLYGPFKMGKEYDEEKIQKQIDNTCGMNKFEDIISGTNTGLALLQSLEILNQLKEKDAGERRFLIMLTDGEPTVSAYAPATLKKKVGSSYADVSSFNNSELHKIRGFLSNACEFKSHKDAPEYLPSVSGTPNSYKIEYGSANTQFYNRKNEPQYNSIIPLLYIKEVTKYDDDTDKQKYYNNFPDTFDKAYLIGFSGLDSDKSMLGFNPEKKYNCPWQKLNPTFTSFDLINMNDAELFNIPYPNEGTFAPQVINDGGHTNSDNTGFSAQGGSIKKFLGLEGTKFDKSNRILLYDTKDKLSLDSAFADILTSIGNVMNAFDGPKPLESK